VPPPASNCPQIFFFLLATLHLSRSTPRPFSRPTERGYPNPSCLPPLTMVRLGLLPFCQNTSLPLQRGSLHLIPPFFFSVLFRFRPSFLSVFFKLNHLFPPPHFDEASPNIFRFCQPLRLGFFFLLSYLPSTELPLSDAERFAPFPPPLSPVPQKDSCRSGRQCNPSPFRVAFAAEVIA